VDMTECVWRKKTHATWVVAEVTHAGCQNVIVWKIWNMKSISWPLLTLGISRSPVHHRYRGDICCSIDIWYRISCHDLFSSFQFWSLFSHSSFGFTPLFLHGGGAGTASSRGLKRISHNPTDRDRTRYLSFTGHHRGVSVPQHTCPVEANDG